MPQWFEDVVTDQIPSASRMWGEAFLPNDTDIEFIYNLLLEEGAPLSTDQIALSVVRERLQREARRQAKLSSEDTVYQPKGKYKVGNILIFPALNFLRGTVIRTRAGKHPEIGNFDVLTVQTENGEREFAGNMPSHRLNDIPLESMAGSSDVTAEQIVAEAGERVQKALAARLDKQGDIIHVTDRWFPRALLAEVSHGHLNLAEAVLDVANGGPLPTSALLEHVDIPRQVDMRLAAFSLEHALYQDERFDEVGPAGEMAWFLRKLEPEAITIIPQHLKMIHTEKAVPLPDSLSVLERELDDEWSASPPTAEPYPTTASIILSYPHWRNGTLPLSSRLASMFPMAHHADRIRFCFIDGEDGAQFSGWVIAPHRYVYGLVEWYQRKGLLPGGILHIRFGEKAGEVVVTAATRRPIREWIRTANVTPNTRLSFSMQKQSIGVELDEHMVIAVADPAAIDEMWKKTAISSITLQRMVVDVFRELAKLNPQSTVHARTVFSAMNVMTRVTPALVFKELAERPYFHNVGDLYYRFEEAQWTENQ
jgi:hypothetical protein